MEFNINIEDNSDKILKELDEKMPEILAAMGSELMKSIKDYMTEDKVVDTGRLRGSISYSTPYGVYNNPVPANKPTDFVTNVRIKDTVVYGSNVEYASYVNSGTTKQRARKFMEIGTARAIPKIKTSVETILKGGQDD